MEGDKPKANEAQVRLGGVPLISVPRSSALCPVQDMGHSSDLTEDSGSLAILKGRPKPLSRLSSTLRALDRHFPELGGSKSLGKSPRVLPPKTELFEVLGV